MNTNWALRYALHLGFRSQQTPLYRYRVGSLDPVSHAQFAAEMGFAGIQYALAMSASPPAQNAFGRAVQRLGLEVGCMIYAPRDVMIQPLWGRNDPDHRALLRKIVANALEVAARIGTRYVAVLSGADRSIPIAGRQTALTENLKWAGDLAAKASVTLFLEPINFRAFSDVAYAHR